MAAIKKTIRAEDIEGIVKRYLAGETTYEIAKDFGVSGASIGYQIKKNGVKLRPKGTQNGLSPKKRERRICDLYKDGKNTRTIARMLKVSTRDIAATLKGSGIPRRDKPLSLNEEQRKEVARRYEEGETYQELCFMFGVCPDIIRRSLLENGVKPKTSGPYGTFGYVDIKGRKIQFKSSWEVAYAEYLDNQGIDWEYEFESYPLIVHRCYTPDFHIFENGEFCKVVEIHGWMDAITENRILEFVREYPGVEFELLGPGELAAMGLVEHKYSTHRQAVINSIVRAKAVEVSFS